MGDAAERETNITWSDADEGLAHIYTAQPPLMRKLAKHSQARLIVRHTDDRGRVSGEEWDLPLECIVHLRAGKRRVSDAQRKAAGERMSALHQAGRMTRVA